ncbi:DUF2459 domain-containing protein [Fulvivirgaceae bacterium BMA12]|uniref:DUF2459 domain-containing protein n=1 Tax=Agaribacillus aureus TaxID=3051825 RepID=A0ABT8L5W2_9BACT|nr:DUF2459 domain-containing protein [Fulvivirgaceae bacterium BMA12]
MKRIMAGMLLAIVAYLLTAVILSIIPTNPRPVNCLEKKEIFVTTNGIHLALILPVELIDQGFRTALKIPPGINFVSFGWGDRAFYLNTPDWTDLKIQTAIKALFVKSETALHVTNYKEPEVLWKAVAICPSQIESLNDFIRNSFKTNEASLLLEIEGAGYGRNDKFYEAIGSYTCIYTCNNWVNEGLKRTKIKTSVWSPFDHGVLYHLGR